MTTSPYSTEPRNILILSHPRSGSSWFGATLANSPIVEYRREPVLQSRLDLVRDPFCASEGLARAEASDLVAAIEQAFANRTRPVVVVKEVTPLLLESFVSAAAPQVIFLRRHPVEVAASHIARGWLPREPMIDRAGIEPVHRRTLRSLWEASSDLVRLVAYFGAVEASVTTQLNDVGALWVSYEDLKRERLGNVGTLFGELGLGVDDLKHPAVDAGRADPYGVGQARLATSPAIPVSEADGAREAWMAFDPNAYTDEKCWEGNPTDNR